MEKLRLTTVLLTALIGCAAPGAFAGGPPRQGAAVLDASSCVNSRTAPLELAQGVILCCCLEAATNRQCCNYVNAATCASQVPGCGC